MRRIIRTIAILSLLGLGIVGYLKERQPKPRVKAPTSRYTGYELNRIAINRAKSFTVLISNEGFFGISRGTGVLIDSTHVLTCAHVAADANGDMWVYPYPASEVVQGRPIFMDTANDLAIVELSKPVIIPHYATFQEMHYDGEPITIIGNTLGAMKWFVSFGIVSGDFDGYILTDGVLYGGNSGGPWINERGEVVAITDWTLLKKGTETEVHGGVSADKVDVFLKAWKAPSAEMIINMSLGDHK